jgi:hypothetical protein
VSSGNRRSSVGLFFGHGIERHEKAAGGVTSGPPGSKLMGK